MKKSNYLLFLLFFISSTTLFSKVVLGNVRFRISNVKDIDNAFRKNVPNVYFFPENYISDGVAIDYCSELSSDINFFLNDNDELQISFITNKPKQISYKDGSLGFFVVDKQQLELFKCWQDQDPSGTIQIIN